ncbi:hypothetical protein Pmar_PMAR023383 [Perkinsus marinus ATCC 50983]|uniref:Uncharacterized protein n=1 Tax=Perkinsus marinus (strain ATCC 50983 / TXsc) TaxID=423536 RepID=C5KKE5_PERM5|nr:hypothetical protein Pmar_PMAR023383 [Perkinsus marinus ATCC 50983]EER15057.1 hypothetical protein Pmar_PMAR023383 [Perkinsus marinus ATCC 50983]|eukprot:XP_002783261.1 hypothetical protein Pmar_PMAR023383 [Perkinsus marinus ATCC 50983]
MPLPYMIFWLRPVATALSFARQNPKVIHAILTTTIWVTLKVHSLVLAFREMAEALGIDLQALEAASAFA